MSELKRLEEEVKRDFKSGGPLLWESAQEQPAQTDLVFVEGRIFNYKTDIHGGIPLSKIKVVTTAERKRRVDAILASDARPDVDRLTNILLHDKLYNPSLTKMQDEEYPVMSERQFDRRQSTEFSTEDDKIGYNAADGRTHVKPTRRKRSDYENRTINKQARANNAERRRKYREFTKVQPVTRWNAITGEIYA